VDTRQALAFPRSLTAAGQPDPLLLEVTRENPVLSVTAPGNRQVWLVSSQALAREVLSDPFRFTSVFDPGLADMRADMVLLDPPDHTRMRRLVSQAFTAGRIQQLAPDIESIAASLLTAMAEAGPPADLVRSLALPLPASVVGLVLGIPQRDWSTLYRWVDPFTAAAPATSKEASQSTDVAPAIEDLYTFVGRVVRERIRCPGSDPLSDLVRARVGDDALTEEELVATAALIIVAGQETASKAITRGVLVLTHSGRWRRLVAGDITVNQVVEEVLRHQSPVDTAIFRAAKVDTELGGVQIKAGEQVFVSLHLANFDQSARRDPDLFDPSRRDQGHMSFGHGPHFCVGAGLARAELTIAFTALAAQFPALRVDVPLTDLSWSQGSVVNAPTSLPVAW
jgi:nocardicin N-oxygenase